MFFLHITFECLLIFNILQVPKPTLKKEPKKKEKESKKGKEAKEPKKEAAPKKEIKKEKKSEPKKDTNLSEVDNILDEWFKVGRHSRRQSCESSWILVFFLVWIPDQHIEKHLYFFVMIYFLSYKNMPNK